MFFSQKVDKRRGGRNEAADAAASDPATRVTATASATTAAEETEREVSPGFECGQGMCMHCM